MEQKKHYKNICRRYKENSIETRPQESYPVVGGRTTASKRDSICWTSLIPKGESISCWGVVVVESGSISIDRQTSRYASPKRSKGGSTFLPSNTEESSKESLTIDKILLKDFLE
jgi:hypothetical protein